MARETEALGNGKRFGFFKEFPRIGNEAVDGGRSEILEYRTVDVIEIMTRNVDVAVRLVHFEMRGIGARGFKNPFGSFLRANVRDFSGKRNERVARSIAILLNGFESAFREFATYEIAEDAHWSESFGRNFQKVRNLRIRPAFAELGEKSGIRRSQNVFFGKFSFLRIVRKTELVVIKIRKEVSVPIRNDDVRNVTGFGMSRVDQFEFRERRIGTVDRIPVPIRIGFVD